MSANLLNYALYQAGWFAAIFGAAWGYPGAGTTVALAMLSVHLGFARQRRAELTLALMAGAVGLVADSTQVALGLLRFPAGTVVPWLCPPWIVVMWMQFATTFRFSLRGVVGAPSRAAVFGAVGGPLAYSIGDRLGAVQLSEPRPLTLGVLGAIWLLIVPVLARFGRSAEQGTYRLGTAVEP